MKRLICLLFCTLVTNLYSAQIVSIHPNMQFGYGYVHVYVLDNGDFAEVRGGAVENLVNPSSIGPAETSPDNWHIGDDVERVIVKKKVWKNILNGWGEWKEWDQPVLVNRYASNTYLQITRYTVNPTKTWESGKISKVDEHAHTIHTSKRGLMIANPGIDLQEFSRGDKVHFRQHDSTHGTSFMVYNETTKKFYYPFWCVSDDSWQAASYRVLERRHEEGYTYYTLDNGFNIKVSKRKRLGVVSVPLFNVGDFAVIKIKEQSHGKGWGLVLMHPKTGEEVFARCFEAGGLWDIKHDDESGTLAIYNYPFRLELENPGAWNQVSWRGVCVALNATNTGYVLLNEFDLWNNGMLYQPYEHDSYTLLPIKSATLNRSPYPGAYVGIFPYEPR